MKTKVGLLIGLILVSIYSFNLFTKSSYAQTSSTFVIQGVRVLMPGNLQGVEPFRSVTVYLYPTSGTYSEETTRTRKAYSWNNVNVNMPDNAKYAVSVIAPTGTTVGYTICYNDITCHTQTPTPGHYFIIDMNKVLTENYDAAVDPYHYVDLWWHFTCTKKAQGDADCDGDVDDNDYSYWKSEFNGITAIGKSADFNANSKTDLVDFEVWRRNRFITNTPTPTRQPVPTKPTSTPTKKPTPTPTRQPVPTKPTNNKYL